MTIRTRFAPSPTGMLHIGGVRTALFCWLYARRHGGVFVLRIEDTDRERSTPEAVQAILEGMQWLGLDHDEGPFYQTARMDRYKDVIDQFLREGKAYHCWCSKEELDEMRAGQMARKEKPRYDGRCRHRTTPVAGVNPVVRFRNPDHGQVIVNDIIHGPITFDSAELDDLIIARSDGTPTYNFCVMVDDYDMRITHVIRGDLPRAASAAIRSTTSSDTISPPTLAKRLTRSRILTNPRESTSTTSPVLYQPLPKTDSGGTSTPGFS